MKLSEAIREGSKIRPQAFDYFYHLVDGQICSCALGAAFEAIKAYDPTTMDLPCDLDDRAYLFDGISEEWGKTMPPEWCPAKECCIGYPIPMMAAHLNDYHRWTREQIADWLEEKGY